MARTKFAQNTIAGQRERKNQHHAQQSKKPGAAESGHENLADVRSRVEELPPTVEAKLSESASSKTKTRAAVGLIPYTESLQCTDLQTAESIFLFMHWKVSYNSPIFLGKIIDTFSGFNFRCHSIRDKGTQYFREQDKPA